MICFFVVKDFVDVGPAERSDQTVKNMERGGSEPCACSVRTSPILLSSEAKQEGPGQDTGIRPRGTRTPVMEVFG